jgi:hypothetical protein
MAVGSLPRPSSLSRLGILRVRPPVQSRVRTCTILTRVADIAVEVPAPTQHQLVPSGYGPPDDGTATLQLEVKTAQPAREDDALPSSTSLQLSRQAPRVRNGSILLGIGSKLTWIEFNRIADWSKFDAAIQVVSKDNIKENVVLQYRFGSPQRETLEWHCTQPMGRFSVVVRCASQSYPRSFARLCMLYPRCSACLSFTNRARATPARSGLSLWLAPAFAYLRGNPPSSRQAVEQSDDVDPLLDATLSLKGNNYWQRPDQAAAHQTTSAPSRG